MDKKAVTSRDDTEVLWINTSFSSIAFVIKELKEKMPYLKIIGTGRDYNCTYAGFVDAYYLEPYNISADDYVKWAIGFCIEHKVTVFMPKSYCLSIIGNIEKFINIGVRVIANKRIVHRLCRDKGKTYEALKNEGYENIPLYRIINNINEFEDYYLELTNSGHEVCIKYNSDEGGSSFRKIDNGFLKYDSLNKPLENILTYDNMLAILVDMEKHGKFVPLMMMEVLSGPEISVDCYNSPNRGFIAIPRTKHSDRIQEITLDERVIEDAKKILDILCFNSAFNVQYRWNKKGELRLLEINTRMSGGVHMSSLSGVSIPYQLVADKIGLNINQGSINECTITQYESPLIINSKAVT